MHELKFETYLPGEHVAEPMPIAGVRSMAIALMGIVQMGIALSAHPATVEPDLQNDMFGMTPGNRDILRAYLVMD